MYKDVDDTYGTKTATFIKIHLNCEFLHNFIGRLWHPRMTPLYLYQLWEEICCIFLITKSQMG